MSDTGNVSEETRRMAARARERARREVPDPGEISSMLTSPTAVVTAEVRRLGTKVIDQAQQVSYLLGKLAALLDDDAGEPNGQP